MRNPLFKCISQKSLLKKNHRYNLNFKSKYIYITFNIKNHKFGVEVHLLMMGLWGVLSETLLLATFCLLLTTLITRMVITVSVIPATALMSLSGKKYL